MLVVVGCLKKVEMFESFIFFFLYDIINWLQLYLACTMVIATATTTALSLIVQVMGNNDLL